MIRAAFAAAEQVFTRPFRAVFLKTLGLTLLLLTLCGIGLEKLVIAYVLLPYAWMATTVHILAGIGLVAGIALLVTPVSFAVAGFFFDELAAQVEEAIGGPAGVGRTMAIGPAAWVAVKFGLLSLLVNAVAVALLFVPGVNVVAFFAANAYLLGRGFFELAALRYRPVEEVRVLRRRHGVRTFLAGCLCAGVASIPILNLLTPLFATAFLVRVAQPIVAPRLEPPRRRARSTSRDQPLR